MVIRLKYLSSIIIIIIIMSREPLLPSLSCNHRQMWQQLWNVSPVAQSYSRGFGAAEAVVIVKLQVDEHSITGRLADAAHLVLPCGPYQQYCFSPITVPRGMQTAYTHQAAAAAAALPTQSDDDEDDGCLVSLSVLS